MHPAEYAKLKGGSLSPTPVVAEEVVPPSAAAKTGSPRGPPLDDDAWLTSAQTRARTGGVSNMCLWRWMRDEKVKFPAPVKINGRNYWRLGDLRRWQVEQAAKGTLMRFPFGADRPTGQAVVPHAASGARTKAGGG